jgi:hypothetical protein
MSSGQFRRREKFNSVIIRDGMVVRLNKNGTIRAVLGKYGEYGKQKKAWSASCKSWRCGLQQTQAYAFSPN